MVMDTTANYGLPAPAAGTPAADYDDEFATAMNSADTAIASAVAGAGGGAGGISTILYVKNTGGDDANGGQTWDTAKATIAGAHTALPTNGGTIVLSGGNHTTNGVVCTKRVNIVGQGPRATVCQVTTADAIGISLQQSQGSTVRDLEMQDAVSVGHAQGGIEIKECQDALLDNVWFNEIGEADTTGQAWDVGSFGLKIWSETAWADWEKLTNLRFRACYRGIVITGASNGFASNIEFFGGATSRGMEHIYVHRVGQGALNQPDVSFAWTNLWLAGGAPGGYQIYLDSAATNDDISNHFTNLKLEQVGARTDGGEHFIYVNGNKCMFNQIEFNGGGDLAGTPGNAVFFDVDASDCHVGPHVLQDQGDGAPVFKAANVTVAGNNSVWQPSDYTRTITT